MWNVFVRPHIEFLLVFYQHETAKSSFQKIDSFINKYWKKFLCLKKNALNILQEYLIGIDFKARSVNNQIYYTNKWLHRIGKPLIMHAVSQEKGLEASLESIPSQLISLLNCICLQCEQCAKPATPSHIQTHFQNLNIIDTVHCMVKEDEKIGGKSFKDQERVKKLMENNIQIISGHMSRLEEIMPTVIKRVKRRLHNT